MTSIDFMNLNKEINQLSCSTRTKAEHKHNSYEFENVARICADTLTNGGAAAMQFELAIESYKTAANRDYEIYTGKELVKMASAAKRDLAGLVDGYSRDFAAGLL